MTDHATGDAEFDGIVAQLVDQPLYDAPPKLRSRVRAEERLPILAPWARDIREFRKAARWTWEHYRHTWAYHLARTPLYAGRVAWRLPVGVWRLLALAFTWCRDREGATVLGQVIEAREPERYGKLADLHRERVRQRTMLVAAAALAVIAAPFALAAADWHVQVLAALIVVGGLSKLGERRDAPIVSRAVIATKADRLTADTVEHALRESVPAIRKDGDVSFPAPIQRDGPGWRADVDLPHGVTVADVAARREALASGLRRPTGAVWPEAAPGQHAGRLILWVGDEAVADRRPDPWPLTRTGTVDLFDAFPFGTDPRGRPVTVELAETNVLIGALPGAGKTFALRLLVVAAALDRRAELHVFELKGTGDLEAVEQVAHRYGSGPDEQTIDLTMASLRYVHAELERRAEVIKGLPREVCPENKVTSDLAGRRELKLHPLVMCVDECQELFTHPTHGDEAARLCTAIIKRGRALGVILLLATQRPDAASLPTGISANVGMRFCLRVMGQQENDMVLGTSMRRNGYDATVFTKRDRGVGWLVGAHDDPVITRTAFVDAPAADKVCARARALRAAAGTLSGVAAGEQPDTDGDTARLLTDILAVVPAGEGKVWSETICARLADRWPRRYGGWAQGGDPETDKLARGDLAAELRRFEVATRQLRIGDGVQSGVRREWLTEALDRRR